MGVLEDAVPGGNLTKPLLIALGALLVGRMLHGGGGGGQPQQQQQQQQANPQVQNTGTPSGSQPGGLGDLLEKLRNAGQGNTVDSWVGPGQNAPIQPGNLKNALGPQISDIARQAGVNEQDLLQQLSAVLPGIVDKLTPNGRVPTPQGLRSLFQQ